MIGDVWGRPSGPCRAWGLTAGACQGSQERLVEGIPCVCRKRRPLRLRVLEFLSRVKA